MRRAHPLSVVPGRVGTLSLCQHHSGAMRATSQPESLSAPEAVRAARKRPII
jgi:hypothetical protein